jgi:hypothetical protein
MTACTNVHQVVSPYHRNSSARSVTTVRNYNPSIYTEELNALLTVHRDLSLLTYLLHGAESFLRS